MYMQFEKQLWTQYIKIKHSTKVYNKTINIHACEKQVWTQYCLYNKNNS
jgi:hypothetical protein